MEPSPLMFESEEEIEAVDDSANSSNKENNLDNIESVSKPSKEERILKGLQTVLMGIPPPPAFTVPQLDCREILKLWRENQSYRVTLSPGKCERNRDINRTFEIDAKNTKWPDILQLDYWDVYYNKNSASEELERLSVRYKERYVGAETSSCINALFAKSPVRTASARKRARNRAWGHSPGRRLSHLARRRKAFSSANLCSVAGNNNPDKKMIMVEIKKIGNRKTGQKKKGSTRKTKPTPKKKIETQSSTFKRALFQSPDQEPMDVASKTPNTQCIQRSKRNLFADSSEKKKNEFGKRERAAPKRVSPRKRVNRSLSFQESSQPTPPCVLPPPAPVVTQPRPLSGVHKQKMLWAATNALREEGMGMSHELFRPCMTVLFRTCQKLWLTRVAEAGNDAGSTSERMLALAKRFSAYTIQEISSDPTSEHMALVYNNSLKMGESLYSQQSSNGGSVSSTVTSGGVVDKQKIGSGNNICDSKRKPNNYVSRTLVDEVASSPATATIANVTGNKTKTPSKIKSDSTNVPEGNSPVSLDKTQINLLKNTPSKVTLRNSPRCSPRLAMKAQVLSEAVSSVCTDLFSTKNGKPSGKVEVNRSLTQLNSNKDSNVEIKKINKNATSPFIQKHVLDSLNKGVDYSPQKYCLVSQSPFNSCIRRKSGETSDSSSAVNSPNLSSKTNCNIEPTDRKKLEKSENNVESVKSHLLSNVEDKIPSDLSCKSAGSNKCDPHKIEHSPLNKKTPSKKVSFRISPVKSCVVSLSRAPVGLTAENPLTLPNSHCDKNLLSDSLTTNSGFKYTPLDVSCQITESSRRRRITRSVSTDTTVKNNKLIHHFFSPPTVKRNKVSTRELSNLIDSNNDMKDSEELLIPPGEELSVEERRVTRRMSSELKPKKSPEPVSLKGMCLGNESNKVVNKNNPAKPIDAESSNRCRKSIDFPTKKTSTRRTSNDLQITDYVNCTDSKSSTQNNPAETSETSMSSQEFLSPPIRPRKPKSRRTKDVSIISPSNVTPNKSTSAAEIISPEIQPGRVALKRTSVISSDASTSRDTPAESVFSADNECSSSTFLCESDTSSNQRSNVTVDDTFKETNKENLGRLSGFSNKTTEKGWHSSHRHLSSVENTAKNQALPEEPTNRMFQLYRLSEATDEEVEKLLPDVVCLQPPKLLPHWVVNGPESEENASPPSLAPHWELESCSGTSTSLPESIMAHWQQMSAKGTDNHEEGSDKVMFDFEDTSYEITFPSAIEDSRASSICAPFDFPLLVDDSKSGFTNIIRRSSTDLSD